MNKYWGSPRNEDYSALESILGSPVMASSSGMAVRLPLITLLFCCLIPRQGLYKMMSCNCTPQGPMHERLDASVHTLPGPETPIKILLRHPYVTTPPYGQF